MRKQSGGKTRPGGENGAEVFSPAFMPGGVLIGSPGSGEI